ncbi:hypothetical protein BGX31_007749 [Mortierella sp. GBA43]|nr:hypothetical protein BGX31_007749 [Mortierella sp. GBA43]
MPNTLHTNRSFGDSDEIPEKLFSSPNLKGKGRANHVKQEAWERLSALSVQDGDDETFEANSLPQENECQSYPGCRQMSYSSSSTAGSDPSFTPHLRIRQQQGSPSFLTSPLDDGYFRWRHPEALEASEEMQGNIESWKDWCNSCRFVDGDHVSPEKLLQYIDQVVKPGENQQWVIARKQNFSYPSRKIWPTSMLDYLVKPVIRLWEAQGSQEFQRPQISRSSEQDLFVTLLRVLDELALGRSINFADPVPMDYSNGRFSPSLDREIISVLQQAQLDARWNGDPQSILTSPLLTRVMESLLRLVRATTICSTAPASFYYAHVPAPVPVQLSPKQDTQSSQPVPLSANASSGMQPSGSEDGKTSSRVARREDEELKAMKRRTSNSTSFTTDDHGSKRHRSSNMHCSTNTSTRQSRGRGRGRGRGRAQSRKKPYLTDSIPFPFNRELESIPEIWKEWRDGWKGKPSIESLVNQHGRQYFISASRYPEEDIMLFYTRETIISAIDRAILFDGLSEREAIQMMEIYRADRTLEAIATGGVGQEWKKVKIKSSTRFPNIYRMEMPVVASPPSILLPPRQESVRLTRRDSKSCAPGMTRAMAAYRGDDVDYDVDYEEIAVQQDDDEDSDYREDSDSGEA